MVWSCREVVLRARYDGPDLADVAREAKLSVDEVIELHAGGHYVVETLGFAPGFAYLTGLDPRLAKLAAIVVSFQTTYLLRRHIVFRAAAA